MKKVWFITGASKGLGLAFTKKLLSEGHQVAATSRSLSSLVKNIGPVSENFLPLEVNLSDEKNIAEAVQETVGHFKKIDVLVNNAGYGQGGAVEEVSDKLARDNFEVNVFGLLNVTRGILPIMRQQKSGHIFNIASIGGFTGDYPGFGIYCGTKFAVAGITEGLKADLSPLGIHTTLVYPGYFRTEFLESSSFSGPDKSIPDYKGALEVLDMHSQKINGNQQGSPEKAAEVMINLAEMKNPPLHFFMGPDSYKMAIETMEIVKAEMVLTKDLSESTNF
jgi:short-subunit dehydrogenase